MSDSGLDGAARLELEVIATGMSELLGELVRLRDSSGEAGDSLQDLEGEFQKATRGAHDLAAGVSQADRDTASGVKTWTALEIALRNANKAQKEFAQQQVSGNPNEPRGINALTLGDSQKQALLDTADASRTSAEAVIRAEARATAAILADIQKVSNARTAAYSEQVAQAQRIDSGLAAASDAARYAGGYNSYSGASVADPRGGRTSLPDYGNARNTASGNDATYFAKQAAQVEYADQATRQYSDTLKKNAAEQNRVYTAAQAEAIAINKSMDAHTAAAAAAGSHSASLPTLRYALYDVASSAGFAGIAMTGLVAATLASAVAFERDFADVRRTVGVTGEAADNLYQKFVDLSTEIPVAFSELTQIGTAAGQLGILESRVASFTNTVAMFAATSNVSTDATATAFGRLDQLVEGVDGQYSNLASSILNVGVNSVATESDIISIATQIAATGAQSKLTADEIIGLSGSLASLGVAPEAARGTVLRVFSQINTAVNSGGEALNDFAAISGMSATDFASQWGTAGGFTKTFIPLLDGLNNSSGGAEAGLRALGITATRDINAILKLSQNTESLSKNLDLAANGFADGSVLTDQFGIIAETTAAKLQVLGQTFQAFLAAVGESSSGPLAGLVDLTTEVLKVFTDVISTDVGQWFALAALSATALIGVMLLLSSVVLRGAASMIALRTAVNETARASEAARISMGGLAVTTGAAGASAAASSTGFKALTTAIFGANAAGKVFKATLISTGVGAAVIAAMTAIGWAIAEVGKSMRTAEERATDYFGSLDGFSEAIRADNVDLLAAQVKKNSDAMDDAASKSEIWSEDLANAARRQNDLAGSTDDATGKIDGQTLVLEGNSEAWLRNAIATDEGYRSMYENMAALDALSAPTLTLDSGTTLTGFEQFDMVAFSKSLVSGDPLAGQKYIDNFKAGILAAAKAEGGIGTVSEALNYLVTEPLLKTAEEAAAGVSDTIAAGLADVANNANINAALDSALGATTATLEEQSASFRTYMDDIYGTLNAQNELADSTFALGEEFIDSGSGIAINSAAMQTVLSDIYATTGGSAEAAAQMQGFYDALINGSLATVPQLANLKLLIDQLTGGKGATATTFDMSGFVKGQEKATTAARKTADAVKQVRAEVVTLEDYASDLSGVFARAFEIRFSGSQGLDTITSGWAAIAQATADTNDQISEYRTTMQSLSADRQITEYWLSVAENYGDALSAGKLRADLAEIDQDLSKTSKDLTKAQGKNSKELDGNSDAAIANRAEILGMVSSYEDYITALANSGMGQAELQAKAAQLKQEFINQATQLGYSSVQVNRYAAAFDDVSQAIARIPRNITVTANADPAIQALNEYSAAIDRARANSAQGITGAEVTPSASALKEQRRMTLVAENARLQNEMDASTDAGAKRLYGYAIASNNAKLANGTYASGGYTGDGGKYEPAGIVHKGEYVFSKAATQNLGVNNLARLHSLGKSGNGMANGSVALSTTQGAGSIQVVDFSAQAIRALADALNLQVVIPGVAIAKATQLNNISTTNRGVN